MEMLPIFFFFLFTAALTRTWAMHGQTEADILFSGHAHVIRKEVATWPHHGHLTSSDRESTSASVNPQTASLLEDSREEVWNANDCNASMVGNWYFRGEGIRDREFHIYRDATGRMWLRQLGSHLREGIRSGVLGEHRDTKHRKSCCFKVTLSDGAVVHLLHHRASKIATETLEVTQVGQNAFPILASRSPPPFISLDASAWLVVAVVLLSGPIVAVMSKGGDRADAASTNASVERVTQEVDHEDWLDVFRLVCIGFMVVRHTIQSLERLGRMPKDSGGGPLFDMSFFLHGLPLFMYVAGRSCGKSMLKKEPMHDGIALSDQLFDHLGFIWRRAWRLLVPSIIGVFVVVIPTEYMGRHWRSCAAGPDDPWEWLQTYLFQSSGSAGIQCEGLGWLGFMVSLFIAQAMLRPWSIVLHQQTFALSGVSNCVRVSDILLVVAWIAFGIVLGSCGLPGRAPLLLRGFLRPETILAFAPCVADLLAWRLSTSSTSSASLWVPSVGRRVLASVALAAWTKKTPYDNFHHHDFALWIESALLVIFYQQGMVDALLGALPKTTAKREKNPGSTLQGFISAASKSLENAARPYAAQGRSSFIAWLLWLLLSIVPISGRAIWGGGFRYPAYCRASAGEFVLRTWAILCLAIWWFGQHLPTSMKKLKNYSDFGFTLYTLHWVFIDLAFSHIYGIPLTSRRPGDLPWWLGLIFGLCFCLAMVSICHLSFKAVTGNGLSWTWVNNELKVTIKTGSQK
jgi:hypothetical protein